MGDKRVKYVIGTIIFVIAIWVGITSFTDTIESKIVLVVTKDQADTLSLNPTRMQVAVEMALQDFHERTGETEKIENHFINYFGDEEEGYRLAKEYIEEHHIVTAIVGDFNSKGTGLLANLADEYSIPHLSFFATDELIFNDKPWSFSYRSRLDQEREIMLNIVTEYVDTKKLAVVSSDLSNVLQRWEQLQPSLEAKGIEIHSSEVFPRDNQNFRQYIYWLKEEQDQYDSIAIFLSSGQIEHFLQQLSIAGVHKPVIAAGVTMSVEGVSELQGVELPIYTFVPEIFLKIDNTDDVEFQAFVERYRVSIGYHRFDSIGPWVYDGLSLLYEIIAEDVNTEQIKQRLANYSQQRMVGPVSFNENGTLKDSTLKIVRIEQGQFVEVGSQ